MFRQNVCGKKLRAYSLIEMSISLLIIGIMSLSLFQLIQTLQCTYKLQLTKHRQQLILRALGEYVYRNSYLPYPCKPSEYAIGLSPSVQSTISSEDPAFDWSSMECIGIVPWRTLGLSQEIALDGNGNPFTYIMHTALGKTPEMTYPILEPKFLLSIDNEGDHAKAKTILKEQKEAREAAEKIRLNHKYASDFRSITNNFHLKIPPSMTDLIDASTHHQNFYRTSKYLSQCSDLIFMDNLDNFISLHYYHQDSSGIYTEHSIHSTTGENTFRLPLTIINGFNTADCIAVVLISHGSTGGHFDKNGKKTSVKSITEAQVNAISEHISPFSGDKCKIYLQSKDKNFDQQVVYVTRFGFHLYGGPIFNNHFLINTSHLQYDLSKAV